jgi:hypothetical protein
MKKINLSISRQSIYLLVLSFLLLIFVLLFSFGALIPAGKEYRLNKAVLNKKIAEYRKHDNFKNTVLDKHTQLQSKHRHIIEAFDKEFNPQRFQKMHSGYFSSLSLSKKVQVQDPGEFTIYEVQTTSQINSPKSFYDFLDAINKTDWIIGVNFPIKFKRENNLIRSSFTMRVYSNKKKITKAEDLNSTK